MRSLDGGSDNAIVLSPTQGGSFTRRCTHDQGGGASLDLSMTETFERGEIDLAGIVEWRRQRGRVA
jgi:hypothetical protein